MRAAWLSTLRAAALAAALLGFAGPARGASISLHGVTFSDALGGFVLEHVSGQGSMDDPFVIVERITSMAGGTLEFRVDPSFGNRIGSQHDIGFELIKVVENATGFAWESFEIELQSQLGVPSDYSDGLSFGQGSTAGRPFTARGFAQVTVVDEPHDRIDLEEGKIEQGGRLTLRFVVTESARLPIAYLAQRPIKPVARVMPRRGGRLQSG
ncbi:MAG TPA: hypothetical protein VFA23_14485 [Dongiaceae bacterium]|nr:hypothetical protein [Dongiaceae bacterium]